MGVQARPANGPDEGLALGAAKLALAGWLLGLEVAAVGPAVGGALEAVRVGLGDVAPLGEGARVGRLGVVVGREVGDEELGHGRLADGLRRGAEIVRVGEGRVGGDGGQLQDEVFVFGLRGPGFLGVDGVPF